MAEKKGSMERCYLQRLRLVRGRTCLCRGDTACRDHHRGEHKKTGTFARDLDVFIAPVAAIVSGKCKATLAFAGPADNFSQKVHGDGSVLMMFEQLMAE